MDTYRQLLELARHDSVDPLHTARVLGLGVVTIDEVAHRRAYQLGSNAAFADATAIVDDAWRVIDLVPRNLALLPLAALLTESPYQLRRLVRGASAIGFEHRFSVNAGEMVIVSRGARIERITLTNERTPAQLVA
jgi:hypothetical protein